ncbi:MAG: hypothetical protein ACR2KB_02215 [Chitinophagaceae bacterium]
MFKKKFRRDNPGLLSAYAIDAPNKVYELWQRDSFAILLFPKKVAEQKLAYLHNIPLAEHWNLAKDPSDYCFSSASFYEKEEKLFAFLKYLWDEL